MKMVEGKVIQVVAEVIDMDESEIRLDTSVKGDLEIDSTEMVDIVVGLEKEFQIRLSQGEQEHFDTIKDIVKCVNELLDMSLSAA